MKRLGFALLVCAFVASTASADLTITTGGTPAGTSGVTTAVAGAVVDTFTDPGRPGWTYGGNGGIQTGPVAGKAAPPLGDTTNYYSLPDQTQNLPGVTTVTGFGGPQTYLGLFWGSIDVSNITAPGNPSNFNNTIKFYSGATVVADLTARDVFPLLAQQGGPDNQTMPAYNQYVNFFFTNGQSFDKVEFGSWQFAFEFDNLAVAVPLPGAVLLGFLGLGFAGMKLRRFV